MADLDEGQARPSPAPRLRYDLAFGGRVSMHRRPAFPVLSRRDGQAVIVVAGFGKELLAVIAQQQVYGAACRISARRPPC